MAHTDSRVWLITGSSSGFGLQLAQTALERGDYVVATARQSSSLDELVAGAPDGAAIAVQLDVTDPSQRAAAITAAVDRFGRLDVLVNNAGFGSVGAVEEIEDGPFRALMETMFFGALALTQAALPVMRRQGSGAIVQISSMGGQVTMPGFGAYCASKFALEAVSESLAAEVAPLGIQVLIAEPGAFRPGSAVPACSGRRSSAGSTRRPSGRRAPRWTGWMARKAGDPAKAAAAIIRALDDDGRAAAPGARRRRRRRDPRRQDARRADLEALEQVSRRTAA